MKEDPIEYAQKELSKVIDQVEEVSRAIDHLKDIVREYFSDELQTDETPMGAMKRNQIRKELLEFAYS